MDALERTLQPTRRVLGDVDPAQPLDTTHPLLDGVQGFWLPLPHLTGGSRLYDLSQRAQHAETVKTTFGVDPAFQTPILEARNEDDDQGAIVQNATHPQGSQNRTAIAYIVPTDRIVGSRHFFGLGQSNTGERWEFKFDADLANLRIEIGGDGYTSSIGGTLGEPIVVACVLEGSTLGDHVIYSGTDKEQASGTSAIQTTGAEIALGRAITDVGNSLGFRSAPLLIGGAALYDRAFPEAEVMRWRDQARRGFPDLLNRRDSVGLLGGGGTTPISGTFALTDSQEQISATGQTEVSGTLSVTDGSETLTLSGATIVSGAASITDAGEIISAVSSLQDITGSAQITDASEQVDATGEVKIAGTATLNDGNEEVIIVGQNDVTGSLSFADLAAEIVATGSVEVQGSLALTDAGETITARERVPARLATVDVRLEDIIVVHAQLTD